MADYYFLRLQSDNKGIKNTVRVCVCVCGTEVL